ncbi:MAG: HlyC/CorC family transporter [Clostridia bacterium]|nr:HlyC/CorC family transporter [Clostridia bacterium]
MDSDSWILFVLLITLILGGGYFAAAETAFASLNPVRIRHRAEDGERRAIHAEHILDNFNNALSTLLIGNNIMHIGTASLSTYLVTKAWGEGYTGISTIVVTVIVFFVSEMIPKEFAKDKPETVALIFAPSLHLLMKLLGPVARIFDGLASWVCSFFKIEQTPTVTEDELIEIIDSLGESEDGDPERSKLLHSAVTFDGKTAGGIMIGLDDVVAVDISARQEDIIKLVRSTKYSRLPVYNRTKDNIIGILHVRSYIKSYLASGKTLSLRKLMRKTMTIPFDKPIDDLLEDMSQTRNHLCLVCDENRKIVGIITMEDILEELVGEILDERDAEIVKEAHAG